MFYFKRPSSKRPEGLKDCTVKNVAQMIIRGKLKNIAFLTGAGISVAAGIPDFRSPGGMYDTLRPELLTATKKQRDNMAIDPTAVVSWDLFKENQFPYMELRRPFILGGDKSTWKPTLAHFFMKLCEDKKLLKRIYTQNIDGLDYHLGIADEKIVPVHGSLGRASCEFCGALYPIDELRKQIKTKIKDIYCTDKDAPKESQNILCLECKMPGVKPSTVLYGRQLPDAFFEAKEKDLPEVDLLVVMGTSLTVGPANLVPLEVNGDCVRMVINREPVGEDLGIDYAGEAERDVFGKGDCDSVVLELVKELGWLDDLKKCVDDMAPKSAALLNTGPKLQSDEKMKDKK
mmetsp:Transcript_32746/g.53025  ORF Transcript_32746/g.53025 Transcript_32746/m.53025 type:complete len:345 (-) Transcript_32746:233-1267(-)|eukprot:jgi/Bigna1/52920/estExt_Genewise1Plus.C_130118